jgi:hypothetical protein
MDHYSAASKCIYINNYLSYLSELISCLSAGISGGLYVFFPQITVWLVIQAASLSFLESASQDSAVLIFIGL